MLNETYEVDVEIEVAFEAEEYDPFVAAVQQASRGEAIMERLDPAYFAVEMSDEQTAPEA